MIEKLPAAYLETIDSLLGDSAPLFLDAMRSASRSGLRLNPRKTRIEALQKSLSADLTPTPWEPNGYQVVGDASLGIHPLHAAGLYYLQEPSAMSPVAVLDPQPGERILDLCAAPGGKSTQILDRMIGKGVLIANDPNPRRVQALARNIERWGSRNVSLVCETPSRLCDHFGAFFDRVLVDAPCSGEGTFRSHPAEIKKWSPGFVERSAASQREILYFASQLVRPGGLLVYSTCTFNQHENEGNIEHFLNQSSEFSLEAIPAGPGFSPGIPFSDPGSGELRKAVRIWPHIAPGEGHFIARLRRSASASRQPFNLEPDRSESPPDLLESYSNFFEQTLVVNQETEEISPGSPSLHVFGSQLFALPAESPALSGLQVVHWGFWLGEFRSGGFIPSPALAASLQVEDAQKVIEFSLGDPELDSYLRGSPIAHPEGQQSSGWTLISIDGIPLGWGKGQGSRVKSHIPSWLRMQ